MTHEGLEKSLLFLQAWKEAGHLGDQAMTAVALALRNRQRAGWENGSCVQIIQHANRLRYNSVEPNPGLPDLRDPIIHRFLARIDGIYDGSTPDTFTSAIHPTEGPRTGKYWANLAEITNERFLLAVVRNPSAHPKTSTVGSLTFFS